MNSSNRSIHSQSSGSAQGSAIRYAAPRMTLTVPATSGGGGSSGTSGSFLRTSGTSTGEGRGGGGLSVREPGMERKSFYGGMAHLMSGRATKSRLVKASVGGRRKGRRLDYVPVLKDGKDVTPLGLMPKGRAPPGRVEGRGVSHMITGLSSALSVGSKGSGGITTMAAALFSGKDDEPGQVRSVFGSAPGLHPEKTQHDDDADSVKDFRLDEPNVSLLERIMEEQRFVKPKRKPIKHPVLSVKIEETETRTILYIPGVRVNGEDKELVEKITKENERYREMLERHKERDKYVNRGVQTFNNSTRNKRVQHVSEPRRSVGTQATAWDIYDESQKQLGVKSEEEETGADARDLFKATADAGTQAGPGLDGFIAAAEKAAQTTTDGDSVESSPRRSHLSFSSYFSDKTSSYLSSTYTNGAPPSPSSSHSSSAVTLNPPDEPLAELARKPNFATALAILEQAVVQNELHQQQLLYRNHPASGAPGSRPPPLDTGEEPEELSPPLGGADASADGLVDPALASILSTGRRSLASATSTARRKTQLTEEEKRTSLHRSLSLSRTTQSEIETIYLEEEEKKQKREADGAEDKEERKGGELADGEDEHGESGPEEESVLDESKLMPPNDVKQRPEARVTHLWSFDCPLTKGLSVLCLAFNKKNQDLLAAGYGSMQFGRVTNGLILFWSLKNPYYPHKAIRTKHSVTSLEFSTEQPNLLAAGMYDGTVAVYDLSGEISDKPTYESAHATGKHSEPVWGLKWVSKDSHRRVQNLVSISSDGIVQQWDMKKGLVPRELMQLKRVPNKAHFITQQTGQLEGRSREASGLCFDFPINDGTQYFVGTEDGIIQKCSVSYNEQVLDTFYGHTGPVYKVKCSPFNADAFLSCSADWTCALWSQKQPIPLLRFISGHDYVMDIDWSPTNACVFSSVSRDGRLEIWDLEFSPLDPVIRHKTEKELTCVIFSPNAPVVFTGCTDGTIDVYRVDGVALTGFPVNPEEQAVRLADAMFEAGKHEGPRETVTIGSVSNTPRLSSP